MHAVESFTVDTNTVTIYADPDAESPRDWDNLGTMVCFHKRRSLGEKHNFDDSEAFLYSLLPEAVQTRLEKRAEREHAAAWDKLKAAGYSYGSDASLRASREIDVDHRARLLAEAEKHAVILPLYLYDHSGITVSTAPFGCPWDSGQVGYVYASLDDIRKEFSCKRVTAKHRAQAEKTLRQEVKTYDQYLTGDVYGYVVADENGDESDSCWGFFGLDYARDEATAAAK